MSKHGDDDSSTDEDVYLSKLPLFKMDRESRRRAIRRNPKAAMLQLREAMKQIHQDNSALEPAIRELGNVNFEEHFTDCLPMSDTVAQIVAVRRLSDIDAMTDDEVNAFIEEEHWN